MLAIGRLKAPILFHVVEFVKLCHADAKSRDQWLYKYYRYLTIDRSEVKKGMAQRAPYWHVDNPDEPDMPVYMVVEGEPTEAKTGPLKPFVVYRMIGQDIHRSPKVKKTHTRTFMRLAYSRRQFRYTQETAELNLLVL